MDRTAQYDKSQYIATMANSINKEDFLLCFTYLMTWGVHRPDGDSVIIGFIPLDCEMWASYRDTEGNRYFYIHAIMDKRTGKWSTHS